MQVNLAYGHGHLPLDIPCDDVDVIRPTELPPLEDERQGFLDAVASPIGSKPLKELVAADEKLAIVIPDITRPLPSHRLLPWVLECLEHLPRENIVIVNGTGSHRGNTPEELEKMVGKAVLDSVKVINHDAYEKSGLAKAGNLKDGHPVYYNKEYVEADRRIVMGFIEPHFIAGFSGGYKAVFPGVLDIDSIMHYHRASVVGDENSAWGVLEGNPTQDQVRDGGALVPIDFCINVTLDAQHRITKYFCGETMAAHLEGCAYSKEHVMKACERDYPIVITTNAGYPLDQNLYQTVKGISAAAKIVAEDGVILSVSQCSDGFPEHGNFKSLLFDHDDSQAILDTINAPGFSLYDQWEAQLLAMITVKTRVGLYSEIAADDVKRAHLEAVADLETYLKEEISKAGQDCRIAVLPEGFMAVPYLKD